MRVTTYPMILGGILTTLASAAAQNGLISGTVMDTGDRPVSAAVIIVCDHLTGIPG